MYIALISSFCWYVYPHNKGESKEAVGRAWDHDAALRIEIWPPPLAKWQK